MRLRISDSLGVSFGGGSAAWIAALASLDNSRLGTHNSPAAVACIALRHTSGESVWCKTPAQPTRRYCSCDPS